MVLVLLSGCSLGTYGWTPCESHATCRDAFGFGSACAASGYCDALEVEPRCTETWPEDLLLRPERYPDAIVVGSLFDHTSDVTEIQATRLAVKQAGDGAELDDRSFALVQCTYEEDAALDALSMEEATVAGAEWLTGVLGAHAFVGPATSGMTEAAWYAVADRDTLVVSPSATSPALTFIDGVEKTDENPGRLWRTAPPDSLQGQVLAEDVRLRIGSGPRTVAVVRQTGPYGEGLAEVFTEHFVDDARAVTLHSFENDTQRDTAVAEVAQADVDGVLFISSELTDVVRFLLAAQALETAYGTLPIFLADAAKDDQLLADAASAADLFDQVRLTAPAVPSGYNYDAFDAAYRAEYAGADAAASSYGAYAYDAAWLVLYGTAWAHLQEGGIGGTPAARGLRRISDGAAVDIQAQYWPEVLAHFEAGDGIDVAGASGELDYDPETEETSGPIDVWTIVEEGAGGYTFRKVDTVEP